MSFATPKDRVIQLQLAGAYAAGAGAMVLQAGQGANFATFPAYFVAVTNATYGTGPAEVAASYVATGKTGDTLTGVSALAGSTDQNFGIGDYVEERVVAQHVLDLNAAVATNTTNITTNTAGIAANTTAITALQADFPVSNANLQHSSVTIATGSGLSGGGAVSLGGTLTLAATGGSGTVTSVAMAGDGTIFNATVAGSPVLTAGTLAPVLLAQVPNVVLAGPTNGVATAPTFRALVGADLPVPSGSTLGGVQSAAAASHQWIDSISTAGVPHLSQPAFTDLTGSAAIAQLPVMIASGASHAAGIAPDPGVSAGTTHFLREDATWAVPAGGGGGSPGGTSGQIEYNNAGSFGGFTASGDATINTATGAVSVTKTGGVAFAASATTDTTVATNITGGTLPGARLPAPTSAVLGGVLQKAAVTHFFLTAITNTGAVGNAQPAFTDLTGSAAVAQLPVMVASGASHAAGIAPDPGASAGTVNFLREDATWAVPPGSGGGSGTVTSVSVVSANGFAGTVATATTTPAITISTSITGILKGNGTAISAATPGSDYLAGNQTITLSGDVSGSGTTAITTLLATVNSNVGSFGTSSAIPSITVNGKGLITAASTSVVIAPAVTLTGTTLASNVVASSLTTVGTIGTGVWQGTAIANAYLANSSLAVTAGAGLSGGGSVALGASTTLALAIFSPTAVKTGAYSAAANDLVPVDASSGSVTITLPTTPADRTIVGVKLIAVGGANTCTVACGGPDVFNKAAGSTTLALAATNQSLFLQYYASGATWYAVAADNSTGGYAAGTNVTITTSGGVRTIAASGGGGPPGGSSGQVQYNSSGSFAGAANVAIGASGQLNLAAQSAPGSPVSGDQWHDSTAHAIAYYESGLTITRGGLIYSQTADVTVGNTTAETTLLGATVTLPANWLVAGRTIRITARGNMSTFSTAPSQRFRLYLGPTIIGDTGSIFYAANLAALPWTLSADLVCRSAGASGTVVSVGVAWRATTTSTAHTISWDGGPVTIDTTASQAIDLRATFSAANASNIIVCRTATIEALN